MAEMDRQREHEEKEDGDGKTKWLWDQSGDEVVVRIALDKAATKKDLKVTFAPSTLTVSIFGEAVFDKAALGGKVYPDECTWCLAEKGSELQLMLACAGGDAKWASLLKDA